jgi:hypothetical protein
MGLMCPVPGKQNAPNLAIAVFPSDRDVARGKYGRNEQADCLLMEIFGRSWAARKRIKTAPDQDHESG